MLLPRSSGPLTGIIIAPFIMIAPAAAAQMEAEFLWNEIVKD